MREEEIYGILKRIRFGTDGEEFLNYLQFLSKENYIAFKKDGSAMDGIHKGYAIAIDALLESFSKCETWEQDNKVRQEQAKQEQLAHY